MPKKFSPELRDRAVRMVYDRQAREGGPRAATNLLNAGVPLHEPTQV